LTYKSKNLSREIPKISAFFRKKEKTNKIQENQMIIIFLKTPLFKNSKIPCLHERRKVNEGRK